MFLAVRIWWAWCVFVISLSNPNLYFVGRQQPAEMTSLALIAILHCTIHLSKSLHIVFSKKLYQICTCNGMFVKAFLPPALLFFLLNCLKIHLLIFFRLVLKLKQLARNTLLVFVFISALCYTRQLEQPVAENATTCWDPSFIYFISLPAFTSSDVVGWRKKVEKVSLLCCLWSLCICPSWVCLFSESFDMMHVLLWPSTYC